MNLTEKCLNELEQMDLSDLADLLGLDEIYKAESMRDHYQENPREWVIECLYSGVINPSLVDIKEALLMGIRYNTSNLKDWDKDLLIDSLVESFRNYKNGMEHLVNLENKDSDYIKNVTKIYFPNE